MTTLESDGDEDVRNRRNPFHFPMMAAAFVVSIKQLVEAWQYLNAQFAGFGSWGATIASNWANATSLAVASVCVLAGLGLVAGIGGRGGRVFGAGLGIVAIALGGAALMPVLVPLATSTIQVSTTISAVRQPGAEAAPRNDTAVATPTPTITVPPLGAQSPDVAAASAPKAPIPSAAIVKPPAPAKAVPSKAAGGAPLLAAQAKEQRFEQCLAAAAKGAPADLASAAARCVEDK